MPFNTPEPKKKSKINIVQEIQNHNMNIGIPEIASVAVRQIMSANITDEEHKGGGPLSNSDQNLRVGAKTFVDAGMKMKHKDSE